MKQSKNPGNFSSTNRTALILNFIIDHFKTITFNQHFTTVMTIGIFTANPGPIAFKNIVQTGGKTDIASFFSGSQAESVVPRSKMCTEITTHPILR